MTRPPHNPDVWGLDQRPIVAVFLPDHPDARDGILLDCDGWTFERFERNGEMASIPYLRCTHTGYSVEAPLRTFGWVQFKDLQP